MPLRLRLFAVAGRSGGLLRVQRGWVVGASPDVPGYQGEDLVDDVRIRSGTVLRIPRAGGMAQGGGFVCVHNGLLGIGFRGPPVAGGVQRSRGAGVRAQPDRGARAGGWDAVPGLATLATTGSGAWRRSGRPGEAREGEGGAGQVGQLRVQRGVFGAGDASAQQQRATDGDARGHGVRDGGQPQRCRNDPGGGHQVSDGDGQSEAGDRGGQRIDVHAVDAGQDQPGRPLRWVDVPPVAAGWLGTARGRMIPVVYQGHR